MHVAHLPVLWDSALGDCLGAIESFSGAVPDLRATNCTSGVVGPLLRSIAHQPAASAEADGFSFGYTYVIDGQSPCAVTFRVTIEQTNVDGPGGSFSVLLEGEGSATFA